MSQHRKKKHPQQVHPANHRGNKIYYRVIPVAVIIFILFGIGITFFTVGYSVSGLATGALAGAVCGFLFGYQIAKGLSKK